MKQFIKSILLVAISVITWELGKETANRVMIYRTQNDEVEVPSDFNINDHIHLNGVR
ncbi:transcriptional activator RinB [Staphylococcus simulans]|uniref:transcriptional activator RinB n=1 Tax=Staphylococcus simulans TaxID=1286 RepID=UPI000D1F67EA|nr:transcriptional regulator [Staphylococcus simulans]PTJ39462.1 transcriptional regulator [Staphylococcus simulans]